MIGGNDTHRHADSHAVDSFSCDDTACEDIAKIRAAPSELAEATAVDTEETTEATALQRMPKTAFSSAADAALLVTFRGLLPAK